MEYSEMTVKQRAEYLLKKGVEAKIQIDPDRLAPGYAAHVDGVMLLPCGYHSSQEAAIEAGKAWLLAKAKPRVALDPGTDDACDSIDRQTQSQCNACGSNDYKGELRECPHCGSTKCDICDMGDDLECAACESDYSAQYS
ncbi:MAG: hypothetical protein AW12_00856 [Candidatus Accumulibacter sp. BA-94]|uniref:hypothetical protein n=1 Tax=Accumulibacter sp. TaxID=2053492 RepID=UPI00044A2AAC|nr:hypothetical protein [Accumulibacter sp.]EXI92113.1 MAG: hypothetical protein AW12_00856 [Candidatus Accumulibacter sp. BA-94]HRD86800.1 hypothetical protein [Accumulibacter sp.]